MRSEPTLLCPLSVVGLGTDAYGARVLAHYTRGGVNARSVYWERKKKQRSLKDTEEVNGKCEGGSSHKGQVTNTKTDIQSSTIKQEFQE